jgi:hypothetical protein
MRTVSPLEDEILAPASLIRMPVIPSHVVADIEFLVEVDHIRVAGMAKARGAQRRLTAPPPRLVLPRQTLGLQLAHYLNMRISKTNNYLLSSGR